MSFEHLCQRCGQGHIRPIQFSYDEAVLTCDNEDCDSHLDVSPWSCIINRNISQEYLPASNQRHIQHWSRSSSSSSGIQSDVRSPGFSPARSFDSVTDREVENLLQRYINVRPKTAVKNPVSCPKPSDEKRTSELNNFSSFFELLDGLDLESTDQQSSKECVPMTAPSTCEDKKFDPVIYELESWMKGFESPMPSHNKDPSQNVVTKNTESAAIKDSLNNRLYIPSRSSAFSQVSPKNDSGQSSSSSCSLVDSDAGIRERNPERSIATVEKTFDPAKNCLPSLNEANFLSPATSIVSDDSGYDDPGSKINSMLLLPSSAISNLGKKATSEKQNVLPELRGSGLENSESSELKTNILPTSALPRLFTQPSVVMNDVDSSNAKPDEKRDSYSDTEQNDIKPVVNTSGILCESSQFNDSISASKTKSSGSSELLSAKTNSNSASVLQEPTSNSDSSLQTKASELCQVKPPPARKSGRPRGRPPKDPDAGGPKRVSKRRRVMPKKEENLPGSASLSRGLASVLQSPSFYVRKDEAQHHNITTLCFRNRLNGSFVEDPWSVPELHLEELSIEIVVQGRRDQPSSQKESKTSGGNPEETLKSDSSRLLETKEIDASLPVTDTLDGECLKPSTCNVGQSSPKDSYSCLKEGYDGLEHEDSDSESDNSSSGDSSSESCETKDSETDSIVKLLVPYSDSSASITDENSSMQRFKCLRMEENSELCDKKPSPSEKDQEKHLIHDETGKQTLKNFYGALSSCSPSRSDLIHNSKIVKVKAEENNGCDLSSGEMKDNSHVVKIKVEENNKGDLPSSHIIRERESSTNKRPETNTLVTSTCVGSGKLSNDESKIHVGDKSMEPLDLPQSMSQSLLDIDIKDALHCSELLPTKIIESGSDSNLDTSFELNLSNLHETDNLLLDFASSPKIRSWMRHKESKPVMVKKEKIDADVPEISRDCSEERKIRGQSSDYFSTLLEDLDFQEEFFQCPTTENPSLTFDEHLSSSLFFGETACSTSASVERALMCDSSASVCTSVPEQSSVSSTVTTVVSPTNMPVLNVSCSLKSTSGKVPQSGMHTTVSVGRIPSTPSASTTSVTQSLHRAIPSIQDISSLPPSASGLIKDKISSDRVRNREMNVISNPMNEKVPSGVNSLAKNLKVEQNSAEALRSQSGCENDEVLRNNPLRIKQEPTSTDTYETSGNSCNSKGSTSANMRDTPFISIDSDDEIQIIMPNEKSLTEKSRSTKSIGQNEDVPELRRDCKVDCLAPPSYTSEHPSLVPLGTSKEASHKEVIKGKKLEGRNVNRELGTEDRCSFYDKTGAGKGLSGIHNDNLMCGILDNSVVHDPSCFSPNAKGFVEFEENHWSEKPPENINFYFGSKKTNFKLCEDLKVDYNTLSKPPQEQLDKITLNERHLGSPDRSSMPFTFEVGSKFGCTKSSPQHKLLMSPTSEDSSIEKMVLDAKNLSFLCYGSSSETCSSSSSDEGDGKYDSETSMSDRLFSSSTKKFALSIGSHRFSSSNVDINTSFYDGSGEESETDREAFSRKRKMLDRGVLRMDSADPDSRLFKKPQMRFKRKLDSTFNLDSPSGLEQQSSLKMESLPCIPAEPLKKKAALSQHKLPIGTQTKFMSTPLHKSSIQSSEKLLSSKIPKGFCTSTVPVNNTLNQKCISSKSNFSKDALENANLLHYPFQKHSIPSNTSIEKPSFCHSIPASSSSLSSTNINCTASSSTTSLKSPSFIDCQMPSVTNSSVIIPPALRSSYAPVQDGTCSVFKDVGSSNKISNMQEKLIVIKNETPNGPVMKVLRVNVIPNSTVKSQDATVVGGSGIQPSTSQIPKPKLNLASDGSDCSERERTTKNFSSEKIKKELLPKIRIGDSSERERTPKDLSSEETKKELLTKVRIGANGKFYVRPTFAMMKAISEMRKTKDQESLSEETEVDCVELPDGIPISHPFQIPSERSLKHLYQDYNKKVSTANKKRRKRRKKYILQRIQNLVKEKVQETVTRSKDEIPEMVAVFIGGKLHIYSRDADRRSAQ